MSALLLAVLLAPAARAADAPTPAVSWEIAGATAASVGSETYFSYKPTVAPGAKLLPDALASAATDFAVVKAEAKPDGTWLWTVLPLEEGKRRFTARWTLDGAPVAAPTVEIPVATPPILGGEDIADIKAPLAARRAWWPWLLAAALGALAWEAYRRWKAARAARPEAGAPAAPPLSPEEAAARALAELAAAGLWERGEHAAYYLRLTDILRVYLEARWGEPATAMTSVEVARLVKNRLDDMSSSARVREMLGRADLVKFARIKPAADEGPADAALVAGLVKATTPRPAATAAEGAK
ncbi:MAG: hypothetical protein HY079_00795 [Elusimicrobia bacterium]|nr:hypothetical protein [Elusimicrobiota bacterium]